MPGDEEEIVEARARIAGRTDSGVVSGGDVEVISV